MAATSMKYGFTLPYGDVSVAGEWAEAAEQAGWDGFFVWEPIYGFDAWVMLAAAAVRTKRIRLGTMITPLSRMRPWKLASEALTLDHLSGGRVTLSVGLGAIDVGFAAFGEETGRRERAELLDEGLDIMRKLWAGEAFRHEGARYRVDATALHYPPPPPVQRIDGRPGIPVWVVGAWPFERSMRRALSHQGIIPSVRGDDGGMRQPTPEELRRIVDEIGPRDGYDVVVEGTSSTSDRERAAAKVRPWAEAGATWYLEARWGVQEGAVGMDSVRARLEAGPPVG